MTVRYVKIYSPATSQFVGVFDKEKEAVIPLSEGNSDYQQYLLWLADGNTPEDGAY